MSTIRKVYLIIYLRTLTMHTTSYDNSKQKKNQTLNRRYIICLFTLNK